MAWTTTANWAGTLSHEQRKACREIMDREPIPSRSRAGYSVYMQGSIGVPRYLELRKRTLEGRVIRRWVITENGEQR